MRRKTTRIHPTAAALAGAALALTAAGCSSDPPPAAPEPEPEPQYEQVSDYVCENIRMERIAVRAGLELAPSHDPSSGSGEAPGRQYVRCSFSAVAASGDERFDTELQDFSPGGSVSIDVYYEPERANEKYHGFEVGGLESLKDAHPGATNRETYGWWDNGTSHERHVVVDPDDYSIGGEFEITVSYVAHLVHRKNLILQVALDAQSPTEHTAEVTGLLHELTAALVDDVVTHLTLTTEPLAPPTDD